MFAWGAMVLVLDAMQEDPSSIPAPSKCFLSLGMRWKGKTLEPGDLNCSVYVSAA